LREKNEQDWSPILLIICSWLLILAQRFHRYDRYRLGESRHFDAPPTDVETSSPSGQRILTARAASSAMINSESSDCSIIKIFAHLASTSVSVGLAFSS